LRDNTGGIAVAVEQRHIHRAASRQSAWTNLLDNESFPPLPEAVLTCYIAIMNSSEVLETLRRSEMALRARGVRHAALFGSIARGDDRPGSDVDIMVEIDPAARITVFDYVGLKEYIAGLFDGPVDVVNRDNLKPYVRPAATADAIYAF
jgi:predicted nucleotidyltransferase